MKKSLRFGLAALKWGVSVAVLGVVVAWLSGWFEPKMRSGLEPSRTRPIEAATVEVRQSEAPVVSRAVGTVRAVEETAVASRMLARVARVHVTAGQRVGRQEVLIELDMSDVQAQLARASASIDAARARQRQAASDRVTIEGLFKNGASTQRELDDARRAAEVADANLLAAEQALEEVRSQLEYAVIRSPIDGVVIDKQVNEGDLARPGVPLVSLYNPDRLQLIASVPERLMSAVRLGQSLPVELDALGMTCQGTVSEIVPESSPGSRSMRVKVLGEGRCPPGVVSGMFGRLLIEHDQRPRITAPVSAVRRVGQLEMVFVAVKPEGQAIKGFIAEQRLVRTAEADGDQIEIVSGLSAGERVFADASAVTAARTP